ncbi:MAG: hypothetical protein HYX27_17870 [Acidobacteria bacterium]|nr:hypothetical protein [Acidobacteriota bacterium]
MASIVCRLLTEVTVSLTFGVAVYSASFILPGAIGESGEVPWNLLGGGQVETTGNFGLADAWRSGIEADSRPIQGVRAGYQPFTESYALVAASPVRNLLIDGGNNAQAGAAWLQQLQLTNQTVGLLTSPQVAEEAIMPSRVSFESSRLLVFDSQDEDYNRFLWAQAATASLTSLRLILPAAPTFVADSFSPFVDTADHMPEVPSIFNVVIAGAVAGIIALVRRRRRSDS